MVERCMLCDNKSKQMEKCDIKLHVCNLRSMVVKPLSGKCLRIIVNNFHVLFEVRTLFSTPLRLWTLKWLWCYSKYGSPFCVLSVFRAKNMKSHCPLIECILLKAVSHHECHCCEWLPLFMIPCCGYCPCKIQTGEQTGRRGNSQL